MSKTIHIRNVPDSIRRALNARAAIEGRSLSDLLLDELRAAAARPSPQELEKRLATREPLSMSESSAALVREERDSR